jgi:hypothetical protein
MSLVSIRKDRRKKWWSEKKKSRATVREGKPYQILNVQYSQRHTMINHCDTRITHLGDMDISFVLLNISSKFLLYLECYILSPKISKKVSQ